MRMCRVRLAYLAILKLVAESSTNLEAAPGKALDQDKGKKQRQGDA